MALNLFCSNATESLAERLDSQLKQLPGDPLSPPPVVVPNPDMAKWLKLTLAAANGVSANLGATFLDSFLWRMAQDHPDVKEKHVEALTQGVLECYILRFFWEAFPNGEDKGAPQRHRVPGGLPPPAGIRLPPAFTPLRATLDNPRSRVELARQLARLFLRYEQERPSSSAGNGWGKNGLGSRWPREDFFSGENPEVRELENWQREIYRWVRKCTAEPTGPEGLRYASLPEVFEKWTPSDFQNHAPETIHLFTPGPLSLFQKSMVEKMSYGREVYLYELTPCMEFWEDLATVKASGKSRKPRAPINTDASNTDASNADASNTDAAIPEAKSNFGKADAPPPPAAAITEVTAIEEPLGDNLDSLFLSQWGRYHQINQTHWHGMETTHADYHQGLNVEEPTCLAQVQQSLATGRNPGTYHRDDSIVFYASPGILREVEWLRHSLVETLHKHPELTLNQIVVKVPDWKAYQPAISQVFDAYAPGEPEYLPYSVNLYTDTSEYCQGMESLLSLLNGPFSRRTVFQFLQNPLLQNLNGWDPHQVRQWADWCEALHIYEGFGEALFADTPEEAGETPSNKEELLHSWKRGFYRLLLGTIAEDTLKPEGEAAPESWFPPHFAVDAPGGGSPEDFIGAVESLWRDLQSLKSATTPEAACQSLKLFSGLWFPLDNRHPEELYCQNQFHDQLDSMALCFRESQARDSDWKILSPLFQNRLSSYVPVKGNFLTHGILFTQWSAWAPLPASVTYLLGLSDRLSPPEEAGHLDLLKHAPRKEDVTREDGNAALLIEHILCTRTRLYLSYVNQDLKSGEEVAPHRLVEEFREFLGSPPLNEIPIVSGENETLPPQLWQDHWIQVMREWPASPLPLQDLWHASWPEDHPLWRKLKPLSTILPGDAAEKTEPADGNLRDLDLEDLARYLRNPLDYHLHNALGVGDYRESVMDRDRPPVKQEFLSEWQWKAEWLDQLVRHTFTPNPERALNREHPFRDEFFADQSARGNLPPVPLDRFAEEEMREMTREFTKALEAFREDLGPAVYYPALGFGSHAAQNTLVQTTEAESTGGMPTGGVVKRQAPEWQALEISADGSPHSLRQRVTLSGRLPHVFLPEDPRAPVVALWVRPSSFKIHHALQPYLFDACRRCHPELQSFFGGRPLILRALSLENSKLRSVEKLKCEAFADAGMFLKNLVEDFTRGRADFLPVEALYDLHKNKRESTAENLFAWLLENTREPASYRYRWEVSRIARKTVPASLAGIVEKRFHSLFAALT